MYYSPHVASPTSSFIFFSRQHRQWRYSTFDQHSIKSRLPFLDGLEFLLKAHRSRYRLSGLATLIDRHLDPPIGLSQTSALFIQKQRKQLVNDPYFKSFYQRGDDLLQAQESLQFKTLGRWIYRQTHRQQKSSINPQTIGRLYPYEQNLTKDFSIQCNFDLNLYRKSIFPVSRTVFSSVQFMLKSGNELFVGLLSQSPNTKLIARTPFFDRQNNKTNIGLCALFKQNWPQMILTSSDDRDPGQHLYYLLEYRPHRLQSPAEFGKLLSSSRHLFLYNPPRILYESNRGSKEQLEKLLLLDFPIYHSHRLGKILAVNNFNGQTHLFADDRFLMGMKCR